MRKASVVLDRIIVYIIYGLILIVPVASWPGFGEPYLLNKVTLLRAGAALVLLLWALSCALSGELKWKRTPLDIPLAGLLAAGVISTIFSMNRLATLAGSIRQEGLWAYFMYAVFFYISAWYLSREERWMRALRFFCYSSALPALMSLLQLFHVDFSKLYDVPMMTYSATFSNRAFYANYLLLVIPAFFYLAWRAEKNVVRAAWIAGGCANLAVLPLTNNRAAMLAMFIAAAVAVLIFGLRSPHRRRVVFVGLGVLVLVVLVIFGATWGTAFGKRLRGAVTFSSDPTASSRLYMWQSALHMIADRPIQGYGLESFEYDNLRYMEPELNEQVQNNPDYESVNLLNNHPHNQTLYMGVSLGIAGIFFYLLLYGMLLWNLYRGFRDLEDYWFYGMVFCAVLAYFISTQFLWDLPPYTFYFWVLTGAALGRPKVKAAEAVEATLEPAETTLGPVETPPPAPETERKRLPAFAAWAMVIVAGGVAIFSTFFAVRFQVADRHFYRAATAVTPSTNLENLPRAMDDMKHALSLNPLSPEYREFYCNLLIMQAQYKHNVDYAWKIVDLAEDGHRFYPTSPMPYAFSGLAYTIAYHYKNIPEYKSKAVQDLKTALYLYPYFNSAQDALNNLNSLRIKP